MAASAPGGLERGSASHKVVFCLLQGSDPPGSLPLLTQTRSLKRRMYQRFVSTTAMTRAAVLGKTLFP